MNRLYHPALFMVLLCLLPFATQASTMERPNEELRNLLVNAINGADSFKDRFDAEVWLLDMSRRLEKRVPDATRRLNLLKNIHYEARRADLPPELVLAVIQIESNFNRWAISHAGAQGLMQIMPFWLDEIGKANDNLFHVRTNLRFGCTILKYYLDKERGDLVRGLARYNGSLGSTRYPDKVLNALADRWYQR
ncbi:MAG: lytic transglycosylase domain-containing protein [Granulosicoccaceae bacterium]